jgi:hypothetical protein
MDVLVRASEAAATSEMSVTQVEGMGLASQASEGPARQEEGEAVQAADPHPAQRVSAVDTIGNRVVWKSSARLKWWHIVCHERPDLLSQFRGDKALTGENR